MPWVAPKTDFVNGDVLTATQMNNVGGDLQYLYDNMNDPDAIQNSIIDAKGDLIVGSAADTPARLAVGTNGQVLTADSAEATGLKWATPASGGGMTLIATGTPSAASTLSFTSIPTTYKRLLVVWRNVYQDVNNNSIYVRLNNKSGASDYSYTGAFYNGSLGSVSAFEEVGSNFGGASVSYGPVCSTTTSSTTYSAQSFGWFLVNRADQSENHSVEWSSTSKGSTLNYVHGFGYQINEANPISRLDFISRGSNVFTGTFYLYGIN